MKEKGATVAIIGSGGAEAALVHKYSQSPHVERIVAIPGNDMMQKVSEKPVREFKGINVADEVGIGLLCQEQKVTLADIRQERAIERGLAGQLKLHRIPVVGPTREAGQLEWDKYVSRVFGDFFKLPQPKYDVLDFKHLKPGQSAPDYYGKVLSRFNEGIFFVKAAGLAEGKGVKKATNRQEIEEAIRSLRREFPDSSEMILIEQGLTGEEFSVFAISDSRDFIVLGYAQDHKQAFDGDQGPNTGGMGAVSHPLITKETTLQEGTEEIIKKTIEGKRETGSPYRGILYPGLMAVNTDRGIKPFVIEFNCRWGDPEAQVVVPGLNVDFFEMGIEAASGTLRRINVSDDGIVRVAVAGVSKGYPGDYSQVRGKEIKGFADAKKVDGVTVYGAAVEVIDERYYANGGRLFYVVGEGGDVIQAQQRAYEAMRRISVEGNNLHYRKDIGWRDVERMRHP